jgi:galactonate dehydratase
MKITDIKSFMVDFGASNYVFIKIYTDEGIEGVGEATLEGKELSVCWKGVTDYTAINGLEQALWDITGKAYNTPVYRLWGGPVREAIRAYTWPGPYTTPIQCGEAAAYAVRWMQAVRNTIGPKADIDEITGALW